jgi:hypothetical protein
MNAVFIKVRSLWGREYVACTEHKLVLCNCMGLTLQTVDIFPAADVTGIRDVLEASNSWPHAASLQALTLVFDAALQPRDRGARRSTRLIKVK